MYEFTDEDLLEHLENEIPTARLSTKAPCSVDWQRILEHFLHSMSRYRQDVTSWMSKEKSREERIRTREPLFRALLLDGLSMMRILGDEEMISLFQRLQSQYLQVLREPGVLKPADFIPPAEIAQAVLMITLR